MRLRIILILALVFAFASESNAQEARIISFRQTTDPMMKSMERKDLNGENCALVKVILPLQGAVFEGDTVGDVAFKTNEYWVYLINGTKLLRIKIPGVMPLMVSFPELTSSDAPHGLQSDCIYELAVGLPEYLYELAARQAMASMPEAPASIAPSGAASPLKDLPGKVIAGCVVDKELEPLIGVDIEGYTPSGQRLRTVSDFEGNFELKAPPGIMLTFKYVGCGEASLPAYNGMKVILGGKSPHQILTEPEGVDIGLSVDWADRNIGALRTADYGGLYYWGSADGFKPTGYKCAPGESIAGNKKYDFATANLGSGWRMPTETEIRELTEKCRIEYTVVDSIGGYRFVGPNGRSVFIPLVPITYTTSGRNSETDYRVAFWTGIAGGTGGSEAVAFWSDASGESVSPDFLSVVSIRNPGLVLPVRPVRVKQPADDGVDYYNLKGEKLPGRPTEKGIYLEVERKNGKARKIQI